MIQQKIDFLSNSKILRGKLCKPDDDYAQAVLFLHGWTGKENILCAQYLAENGYVAMTFGFEGHNESEGSIETISRADALQNAIDAYRFLSSNIKENTPIAVVGNSFGGYIAALLTTVVKTNGLSMRVPANYPDESFDEFQKGQGHENPNITAWRKTLHSADATRSLRGLSVYKGPVQIIEAEQDEIIPHETVQAYVYACRENSIPCDYHLMKGWPHSIGSDKERIAQNNQIIYTWLKAL